MYFEDFITEDNVSGSWQSFTGRRGFSTSRRIRPFLVLQDGVSLANLVPYSSAGDAAQRKQAAGFVQTNHRKVIGVEQNFIPPATT